MRKTLTAGLTALSLMMVPAGPVHADGNDTLNKAIIGLLAAGALGLAINNSKDDTPYVAVQDNQRFGNRDQPRFGNRGNSRRPNSRHSRRADPLPDRCFRRVELSNGGVQTVYAARCLERRYRDADTLPRECVTRIGGRDGSREGYEASCLRDYGYQSDRRW